MTNLEPRCRIQNAQNLLAAQINACAYFKKRLDESGDLLEDESQLGDHLTAIENALVDSVPLLGHHAAHFDIIARSVTSRKSQISLLPNELLREALALAIHHEVDKYDIPFRLSRVCRLWRELVLTIRWPWFCVSFYRDRETINRNWEFISRGLRCPPQHLQISGLNRSTSHLLADISLASLSTLHKLDIILELEDLTNEIESSLRCSCLDLRLHDTLSYRLRGFPFFQVLGIFHNVQRLQFITQRDTNLELGYPATFTSLKEVTLSGLRGLPFSHILKMMPSLDILRLENICFISCELEGNEIALVSTISSFALLEVRTGWLRSLQCPNLTSLTLDGALDDVGPSLVAFISEAPMLKSLTIVRSDLAVDFALLVPHCQQVEYLGLSETDFFTGAWQSTGSQTPFPNLKTVDATWIHDIDSLIWSGIISRRCLPKTHPRSNIPPGLQPVNLLVAPHDQSYFTEVLGSKFMAGATCEIRSWEDAFGDERLVSIMKWSWSVDIAFSIDFCGLEMDMNDLCATRINGSVSEKRPLHKVRHSVFDFIQISIYTTRT
ncbi:hypothetical protein PIIN_07407 [Serendipita indica DSM 11827]|uniref:F-box domain-containing protein n=1 Tax=Serendipita indica (strain DSM 11827) TaxID=1109443 RepID=G4TQ60_SERID|nr:hypothetical protein PIIN_07407 [Serendipita indica DSM 11827]